ncbi:hypothetical protein ACHFJ0_21365 [Paracoccus sp. NGMCC 1.201697]|uniref:PepSY domain-containing protein n=1 Tax=Paracoccus broussonetiae subsp. drimophilus TaxID=3373869 RepID=A0ABW7LVH1_9RHOB
MLRLPILCPVLLAACAAAEKAPDGGDLHARQEATCTATIAAHVGRPQIEVTSHWLSETGGIAKVEAIDGSRRHLCDVDASGRVLGYSHPDA